MLTDGYTTPSPSPSPSPTSYAGATTKAPWSRPAQEVIREHSFTWLRAVLLTVAAAAFFLLMPDPAPASSCGGPGERACCLLERIPSCNSGLDEFLGCPDSGCGGCSLGTCWAATPCGGAGERACCVGEASFGACKDGFGEQLGCSGDDCQCGNLSWGTRSIGTCRLVTSCGGPGERACCVGEASFGACQDGLAEKLGCTGDCLCSDSAPGTVSVGTCVQATPCGGEGERACCVGEAGGACESGLIEALGCFLSGDGCLCEGSVAGISSSGTCRAPTPCGGPHERACCLNERVPSCDAGLVEVAGCDFGDLCQCGDSSWGIQSSGTCRPVTPYKADTWIEDTLSKNPHVRLRDILIPEAHDAGSYGVTNASAWDSIYVDYANYLTAAKSVTCAASGMNPLCWNFEDYIGDIVRSWTVTQYTDLHRQLSGGARSLDLRSTDWFGEFRLVHGFVVTETTLQTALDDIARFAQDHPKEVFFIDFRPPTSGAHTAAAMINDTLGSYIADVSGFSPTTLTVQHVWDTGRSIVFLARDGFEAKIDGAIDRESWTVGDRFDGTTDPISIEGYVAGQLETADDELERIFQLSLSTTTSDNEMFASEIQGTLINFLQGDLINPSPSVHEKDGAIRHLRDGWLRDWMQDPEKSRAANVFLIDFVLEASDFIDEVIGQNQARFFSDDFSVDQNGTLTGDLLDGAANALGATVVIDSSQTIGSVTDHGDGTFGYYPDGQFFGLSRGETATDTFTYEVTYASGNTAAATATITVTGPPYVDSLNYSDVAGIDFYFVSDTGFCADAVGDNDQSNGPASVMRLRDCSTVKPEFFRWASDGRIRPAYAARYLMTHVSGQIRHYSGAPDQWEYTADRKIRKVGEAVCMTYGSEGHTITWVSCDSSNVGRWNLIRKPDDSAIAYVPFYFSTSDGYCADAVGYNDQYTGADSRMYLQDCDTADQETFLWTSYGLIKTSWSSRSLMKHVSGQLRHYSAAGALWEYTHNGKLRMEEDGEFYCVDHGGVGELITLVRCDAQDVASWKLLRADDGTELMVRGEELISTSGTP